MDKHLDESMTTQYVRGWEGTLPVCSIVLYIHPQRSDFGTGAFV